MKKDYSGTQLSPKTNKVLLVLNVLIFVAAVFVLAVSLKHEEVVMVVGMLLVMVASAGNAIMSFIRLKGKKMG